MYCQKHLPASRLKVLTGRDFIPPFLCQIFSTISGAPTCPPEGEEHPLRGIIGGLNQFAYQIPFNSLGESRKS